MSEQIKTAVPSLYAEGRCCPRCGDACTPIGKGRGRDRKQNKRHIHPARCGGADRETDLMII